MLPVPCRVRVEAAARAMAYFMNRTSACAFASWRDFAGEQADLRQRAAVCIQVCLWLRGHAAA